MQPVYKTRFVGPAVRTLRTMKFGSQEEEVVVERSDYPREQLKRMFAKDTFAVLGYGVQVLAAQIMSAAGPTAVAENREMRT